MYEKPIRALAFASVVLSVLMLVVKTAEITLRIAQDSAEEE